MMPTITYKILLADDNPVIVQHGGLLLPLPCHSRLAVGRVARKEVTATIVIDPTGMRHETTALGQ